MLNLQLGRTSENARGGFTLVEVLTAVSLLALFASGALWTLTQANSYAALSRLYTGAQAAAQNEVDLIMSRGPFNPQNLADDGTAAPQWPVLNPLKSDGITPTPANEQVILKPGTWPASPPYETVTIYSEPPRNQSPIPSPSPAPITVTGQRVTTVYADNAPPVSGRPINIYYATVVVTFSYRGVQHQVQLNALRASDSEGG